MFGLFSKKNNVDLEFKQWVLAVFQEQLSTATYLVTEKGLDIDLSPDAFIGGYLSGLVDGSFQRAGEAENRERVLATTKSVFIAIYQEVGGESFFNMVVTGIVQESPDYVEPYLQALKDHEWHQQTKTMPGSLGRHIASKSGW